VTRRVGGVAVHRCLEHERLGVVDARGGELVGLSPAPLGEHGDRCRVEGDVASTGPGLELELEPEPIAATAWVTSMRPVSIGLPESARRPASANTEDVIEIRPPQREGSPILGPPRQPATRGGRYLAR